MDIFLFDATRQCRINYWNLLLLVRVEPVWGYGTEWYRMLFISIKKDAGILYIGTYLEITRVSK